MTIEKTNWKQVIKSSAPNPVKVNALMLTDGGLTLPRKEKQSNELQYVVYDKDYVKFVLQEVLRRLIAIGKDDLNKLVKESINELY